MDLNKERIEFEAHASKFFNNKEEAFKVENDQYIYDEIIWMWDCWLKAKSQVLDGFVLVRKEPTVEAISKMCQSVILGDDENGNPVYLSTSEANEAYLAIIESQEKTHD